VLDTCCRIAATGGIVPQFRSTGASACQVGLAANMPQTATCQLLVETPNIHFCTIRISGQPANVAGVKMEKSVRSTPGAAAALQCAVVVLEIHGEQRILLSRRISPHWAARARADGLRIGRRSNSRDR